MYIRSYQTAEPKSRPKTRFVNHHRPSWKVGLVFVAVVFVSVIWHTAASRAASVLPAIQSGVSGYCLDLYRNSTAPGSVVGSWQCNHSVAQAWTVQPMSIRHGDTCLSVQNNGTHIADKIVADPCSNQPGQVWLRERDGLMNPNSGMCLALPDNQTNEQLILVNCKLLGRPSETWRSVPDSTNACTGTKGDKIACYAAREWQRWQAPGANHSALLTDYTDGYPYESWCADFVSYVYREAGYPFTGGEGDGWDENNALLIQDRGFTRHNPNDYMPKPGDVAFFNYEGGHVEIVVSGGPHPTFIYGNSAEKDPATGNGQMKANTVTDAGDDGQLMYYLSPNI